MDIICDYAMVEIADVRLQKEMSINAARFFRKMSFYVINAIPRFNRPPIVRRLLSTYNAPTYADFDYVVPNDYTTGALEIATGETLYNMVNAVVISPDGYGSYEYKPLSISYEPDGGIVTVNGGITAGDAIAIDFYNDGYFFYDLSVEVKRILGLLVQVVWENRFINDFLLQQPKIKDKSFDVGNEANHMRAASERFRMLNEQVNQEMRQLENNCAYFGTVMNDESSHTVYSSKQNVPILRIDRATMSLLVSNWDGSLPSFEIEPRPMNLKMNPNGSAMTDFELTNNKDLTYGM